LRLIFLIVARAVSLLGLSRREWWWKDAEILMLRHQLAVAQRQRPRVHARLTWPDQAWLALLAGTLPIERLAGMRLIVAPGTVLRWQRDIVGRRWACRSRRGRPGLGGVPADPGTGDPCAGLLHRRPARRHEAAPLRPLPDGVTDLDHLRVRRRDRAGSVIREYRLVA
jgi:hypothetical protein